jgi:hypothetical protein
VYKNSVKANNQRATARGTNKLPIKKYASGVIPTPLDRATKKDKLEGHQGDAINTQVAPTKKYTLSLYLKYLVRIIKPTNKEIATKISEKTPFNVSKKLNVID